MQQEVALEVILLFAIVLLLVSFFTLEVRNQKVVMYVRIMQCVFFAAIGCLSATGLGIIK
ncbi:hypothetical protein D3C78_762380 [compost metagenome]